MLIVNLPKNEKTGQCKINGQPQDYTLQGAPGEFWFRPQGDEAAPWEKRTIASEIEETEFTRYICG